MPKYYQVSKVLAVRTVNGDKEYLLRWKGYGSKADSWVKEEDCNSAIKNYAALSLEGELIVRMNFVFSSLLFLLVVTCFLLFIPARKKKVVNYLVREIGQKLSTRTAPEKGYVRRTTV